MMVTTKCLCAYSSLPHDLSGYCASVCPLLPSHREATKHYLRCLVPALGVYRLNTLPPWTGSLEPFYRPLYTTQDCLVIDVHTGEIYTPSDDQNNPINKLLKPTESSWQDRYRSNSLRDRKPQRRRSVNGYLSPHSKSRLMRGLRSQQWTIFLTLGYGEMHPTDGGEVKRHLRRFINRMQYRCCTGVWRLEAKQETGSPHFHIALEGLEWSCTVEQTLKELWINSIDGYPGDAKALPFRHPPVQLPEYNHIEYMLKKRQGASLAVTNAGKAWGKWDLKKVTQRPPATKPLPVCI